MSLTVTASPPPDLTQAAVDGLRRHHAVDATAVGRAPGRVNLIGEHTDYLGGLCLPIALAESTWVAVGSLPGQAPGVVQVTSGDDLRWRGQVEERSTGWEAYVLGSLQAVRASGGLALHVESTVPVGAGLSSSAALICAVLRAISPLPNADLVAPAIAAEVEHVGAPTGGMDQSVALLATPGHALLLDFGTGVRRAVPWDPESADLVLLVVDTGVRHDNAGGDFARRRSEATAALSDFGTPADPVLARRRRHVLSENRRTTDVVRALGRQDWAQVGELFIASHRSLRDDHEVSCAELDLVVSTSLAAGALGARMTGGGFGGCALVLCAETARATVVNALRVAFAARSWPVPTVRRAVAAGPASRVVPGDPRVTSWT